MTVRHRRYAEDQGADDARLDDAALIERSWHEPEAFAVLYDRHAAPIHRFAGRRLGDQLAGDVVGETFLAAFRRRKRYDLRRADARPWLYGIAANLIGKHRRAEVRMFRAFARTGIDPVADSHADRADSRISA
ncbi:MAG: RNA polymerase sigma factor, partial [Streptosporangiaceae bacterium]